MNRAALILAACGLSAAASAQNTRLICEVSTDLTGPYSSSIDVPPGATYFVQVRVQCIGTATVMGLAGLAFQPTLSNWFPDSGDATAYNSPPSIGRLAPFGGGGQGSTSASGLLTGLTDPGNILRFAGSKATTLTTNIAWGVNSAQLTQQLAGSNYNSSSDVLVFRYRIDLGDVSNRDMLATIPLEGINHPSGNLPRATWYTSANGTDSPNLVAEITSDFIVPGVIHVIPAPGAAALLGAFAARPATQKVIMKFAATILAACGLAASAAAQNTRLLCEVSADGGATYSSSVTAAPGDTVFVQVRVKFIFTMTVLGLEGIAFQPTLSNWRPDSGDTERHEPHTPPLIEPALGRIFPFTSVGMGPTSASGLLTAFNDPGNTLRFAGSKATTLTTNVSWGVLSSQLRLSQAGTNFNTALDVVVFRYAITLGTLTGRDLIATTPLEGIGHSVALPPHGTWYVTDNGTDQDIVAVVTSDFIVPGVIHVIPAPGAAALLGAFAARPRRRKSL